jgi:hypothetical protein
VAPRPSSHVSFDLARDLDVEESALIPAVIDVIALGFRSKTVLGPKKHVWDFVHRVVRKFKPGEFISMPV